MRWVVIAACVVVGLVLVGVVLLRVLGPAVVGMMLPTPGVMYPAAPGMPAVVATPVEELLGKYEAFLRAEAPGVLAALQPGLSDAEIDALEKRGGFTLPGDLRALYRWRNGMPRNASLTAFPDDWFVPLDEALAERDELRKQVKGTTAFQKKVYATYAGHRDPWVSVIVDAGGDGYFFDPGRTEAQGSFFYCFAEDGSYVFFPAFRNYLAGVVEGQAAGIFKVGATGVETADFEKANQWWKKYGAEPPMAE